VTPPPAAAAVPGPVVRPRHPARHGRPVRHGRPAQPLRPAARPRRVSGPARARSRSPRGAPRAGGWAGSRLFGQLLDRLIWNPPARAWIGLVAFALIGIVAMQLWVVKLGVGIGHALVHAELLQRENSALAIEDSSLSSGERVERLALARGMVIAPPGALHFDTLRGPLDARLAAAALAKPVQTQSAATGTSVATGAEASSGATSGTEASPGAASGTGASAGAGTETNSAAAPSAETSVGATTGAETSASAGGETASQQTPATQAPSGEASPAGAPAVETPPASAPAGTGGSAETVSPQTGSGSGAGGTQVPPGG
jgi:hypothetical protein